MLKNMKNVKKQFEIKKVEIKKQKKQKLKLKWEGQSFLFHFEFLGVSQLLTQ